MTSTPGPLDEPVDTSGDQDTPGGAPVSGSPAAAESDLGYSRGAEGESAEQAGDAADGSDRTDYLDGDVIRGGPGDSGNL
jgi:hypothetical protein